METRTIALAAVIIAATTAVALAITPIISMSAFAVKDTRCGPHGSGSGDPHDAENPHNPHDTQLGFNTGNPHDSCTGS